MGNRLRMIVRGYPLFAYFVLAFGISWSFGLLLIGRRYGLTSVQPALHYLTSLGPALAALIVTGLVSGHSGLNDLGSRVVRWRIGWRCLLIACASPLLLAGGAVLAQYLLTSSVPDLGLLGRVEYLGNIGVLPALLLWIITFGFGEEVGWRGFALDTMQRRGWSLLRSSGVIGLLWAMWHLPAFFYKPTFMALGAGGFAGYALGIVSGSILLAWLYNGTGGSIFAVAIWHALFDFIVASPAGEGMVAAVTSTGVMLWASMIVVVEVRRHIREGAAYRRSSAWQTIQDPNSRPMPGR